MYELYGQTEVECSINGKVIGEVKAYVCSILDFVVNKQSIMFNNVVSTCNRRICLRIVHWIAGVRETIKKREATFYRNKPRRSEVLVGWETCDDVEVIVNTDGSVINIASGSKIQALRSAAGGGILRDPTGICKETFTANFGGCSITRAEIRAAIHRLQILWDKGYRRVNLQVDSSAVVSFANDTIAVDTRYFNCIKELQ